MPLSDVEKEKIRLIISENPSPVYMQQLSQSDTFALSEIARLTPFMINRAINNKSILSDGINSLTAQISVINANLIILQTI